MFVGLADRFSLADRMGLAERFRALNLHERLRSFGLDGERSPLKAESKDRQSQANPTTFVTTTWLVVLLVCSIWR